MYSFVLTAVFLFTVWAQVSSSHRKARFDEIEVHQVLEDGTPSLTFLDANGNIVQEFSTSK